MSALPDTDSRCSECQRYLMNAIWTRGDLRIAKRRLIRRSTEELAQVVRDCKAAVDEAEGALFDHLERVHLDGVTRTTKPHRVARVAKPDGKVECPVCKRRLSPMAERFRGHRDKDGAPCSNISLPDADPIRLAAVPDVRPSHHDAKKGECRECHRWLPGERSLCGKCANAQARVS